MIDDRISQYCFEHTTPEPQYLLDLIEGTKQNMGWPDKLSGRLPGRILKFLSQLHRPKRVLEIGMFTGYSALSMAEGMPEDGEIITCESNPKAVAYARKCMDASPHKDKIHIQFGIAKRILKYIDGNFDMVFIDADKRGYKDYVEMLIPRLNQGGLLIIDNALWYGKVLDPQDESDEGVHQANQIVVNDPRVENVLLSVQDGINIVRKL